MHMLGLRGSFITMYSYTPVVACVPATLWILLDLSMYSGKGVHDLVLHGHTLLYQCQAVRGSGIVSMLKFVTLSGAY